MSTTPSTLHDDSKYIALVSHSLNEEDSTFENLLEPKPDVVVTQQPLAIRPRSWNFTSKRFIFANFLCFSLVLWTFTLAFATVYIGGLEEFSATKRTVYTSGIAVLASCITLYLASHIRSDWLKIIDLELPEHKAPEDLEALDRTWRTALGIASPSERWAERKRTGFMQFSLAFAALLTAALVASMTPTTASVERNYRLNLPDGNNTDCAAVVPTAPMVKVLSLLPVADIFLWKQNDTASLAVSGGLGCPASAVTLGSGNLNDVSPTNFSYSIQGTAFSNTAIGTHQSLITYTSLSNNVSTMLQQTSKSLGGTSRDLSRLTQCSPLLVQNPVKCRSNPDVRIDQKHRLVTSDGTCHHARTYDEDLTWNYTVVSTASACLERRAIGTGSIMLSASNTNAAALALSIGDMDWVLSKGGNQLLGDSQVYSATCDFDIPKAIGWRETTVDLRYTANADVPFSRMVYGGVPCTPATNLSSSFSALVASGLLPLLTANSSIAGWMDLIMPHIVAQNGAAYTEVSLGMQRSGPWAFKESAGSLEDVLGLLTGMAMSNMPLTTIKGSIVDRIPAQAYSQDASYLIEVVRMGAGETWAIVFAIPPMMAWFFVIYLRLKVADGQPMYFSSHMTSLLRYGRYRDVI